MKVKIVNLQNNEVGEMSVNNDIFALTPRVDIMKLVVDWQRVKAMAGTHKTKTVSEVSGTTKKPFKQKGTGNARQGSLRSNQMRGGGNVHGPVVRSHATHLNKKIRKLGLKLALSSKFLDGKLFVIDSLDIDMPKTISLSNSINNFNGKSFLIIGDNTKETNIHLAARNIPYVQVIPQIGANVYDILKYENILISQEAMRCLEERLI